MDVEVEIRGVDAMGDGHRRGLARRAGYHVTPFCRVRRARISLSFTLDDLMDEIFLN